KSLYGRQLRGQRNHAGREESDLRKKQERLEAIEPGQAFLCFGGLGRRSARRPTKSLQERQLPPVEPAEMHEHVFDRLTASESLLDECARSALRIEDQNNEGSCDAPMPRQCPREQE